MIAGKCMRMSLDISLSKFQAVDFRLGVFEDRQKVEPEEMVTVVVTV